MLAHAEMQIAAARRIGFEFAGALKVRRVLVEGARSAEPPISQGYAAAMALRTLPEESRRGKALGIGRKYRKCRCPSPREVGLSASVLSGRQARDTCCGTREELHSNPRWLTSPAAAHR